jgi:hypothetical protein
MTTIQIAWNFRVYDAMLVTKRRWLDSYNGTTLSAGSGKLYFSVFELWHAMRDIHAAGDGR